MADSAPAAPARVLVIEDERLIRSALEVALRQEGFVVRVEREGTAIEEVVEEFRPDLTLLDVHLGDGPDGYEVARRLRQVSDLPLLFLTSFGELKDRLAGFEVGGDDYVTKPFAMEELLARVRALLRRAGRLSSAVCQVGGLIIDDAAQTVMRAGNQLDLTPTEASLLGLLARHPGRFFSKTQLLSDVWGFDAYDVNLVEVHVSSLRRKLEEFGPRLVQTVRNGYVLKLEGGDSPTATGSE